MSEDTRIRRARSIAKKRYEFRSHLFTYLIANALFVVLWFFTGWFEPFAFGQGLDTFFWPIIPIVFWGLFLVGDYYDTFRKGRWVDRESERILREEEGERRGY
ncbi:MAG: 2TM domain-containing protein [Thermoplasmata archaeon]